MPHFVIDCSENIINFKTPKEIIQKVYDTAESTELFDKGDIKVRINPYKFYTIGNTSDDFIHIFANIMEGRSTAQKSNLSKNIIEALKPMFPEVPIISINIRDFEKATYCNKSILKV
ncbi:5-carboxymethyl-2-hydroxymuconate Delta-isomerase [Arenibacter sp. F20364]|uniref:5-carboxymethyl-2-hydroxymuconate Delta-isomerase n=1 Tax=Arenibacter sp. F20364 TaxID=2926415 RepID=UPI001FF4B7A1|nr:5-carboxymethyl-2-hydroxymuconate Delta-isomerase [Arenibacter sp. F20364]MCK0190431.1 5-carboxymethyl-2-hydroxymuconate Delta-isomerase [Arenibacter sp. F20364]